VILLTVGHQMPFDRLVRAVDGWAALRDRSDIFAQVGEGRYRPTTFPGVPFLTPSEFRARLRDAHCVVAHAGTGTMIAALLLDKPLLVIPRIAALGETRNDHQVATARRFEERGAILAAYEDEEIASKLDMLEAFRPSMIIGTTASDELIHRLRGFAFARGSTSPGNQT
jgi:UDP-N-acetylglucosamine transferase subunit ALG13